MEIKWVNSTLSNSSELKPHHQVQFRIMPGINFLLGEYFTPQQEILPVSVFLAPRLIFNYEVEN